LGRTYMSRYKADVVVIGGGIAGIVTALEVIQSGKSVVLIDRDSEDRVGGLAKESFGGMFFVDSPEQRRGGIKDSQELAFADWQSFAEFGRDEIWTKRWAELMVERCTPDIYEWLKPQGVSYLPVVGWVERGQYTPGNSVPRFHIVWGTGQGLTQALIKSLTNDEHAFKLQRVFGHKVEALDYEGGKLKGCVGQMDEGRGVFHAEGDAVVIAAGGINGNMDLVRHHWHSDWGDKPPETILNGSHKFADGLMHASVMNNGGQVTHLDRMWNYAAGVHHPRPHKKNHGLSLVPCKSALWMDAHGRRIGPEPLVSGYDTRELITRICRQEHKYSWQILNKKIALKELAISGSEFNPTIREQKRLAFLKTILFGNHSLVDDMVSNCVDFVMANSVGELVEKMNALGNPVKVDKAAMEADILNYDAQFERGEGFFNDDQIRRVNHLRTYKGDKVRTCKNQPILDPKAMPLIAIREFIISRKSLGGIQTDLQSRVLDNRGNDVEGGYDAGGAAGCGGGGIHGLRALEGTFLGSCILTARRAAQSIKLGR